MLGVFFQIKLVDKDLMEEHYGEYYRNVTSKLDGYDDVCMEARMLPENLKTMWD